MWNIFRNSVAYGWHKLTSRKIYFACMVALPVLCTLFFISLMNEGLPLKVPAAVVDLDRSQLSRRVVRNLSSTELVDVVDKEENYHSARAKVRSGEIFGFFLIPHDFQKDALSGKGTTVTFYSNLTVFVPGTLVFKGFKTVAVTTAGGVAMTTLSSLGINEQVSGTLLQPVVLNQNELHNPWTNYSVYLTNSFIPGVIALMVTLMACFTLCEEIKQGTSPQWLRASGGSMLMAVIGKLLPQAVIFSCLGVALQAWMYCWAGFPLNCNPLHMVTAMILLVLASQGFGLLLCCAIPNLRLSLSLASLTGILAFSIAAYSFPVQSMYGAIGIFSYILPVRYYFLIYTDQALNGVALWYSRWYYLALVAFIIVPLPLLPRLKKHCLNPVYVA